MGSDFSFAEAANRLGCSVRTIHNYVKRGYIRKVIQNGKTLLKREDVEQMGAEVGADLPAFNRKSFYALSARVQKLEMDMTLCRRALEIREDPLRPTKEEAQSLFGAASKYLALNQWSMQDMESWASVFDRLDEVAMDRFSEVLASKDFYGVFFMLCLNQMRFLSSNVKFESSLDMQLLYKKLDAGRRQLRGTILMWLEMGRGTLPESLLRKLESGKDVLFDKLAVSKGKSKRT